MKSVEKVTYVTFLTVTFAHKIVCFKWVLDTSQLLCAWSLQMWPNILKKFVDVVKCAIWKKMRVTFFSHLWITSVIYIFLHLLHILSCRHTSLNGLLHIWDLIGLKITCVYKHSEKMRWCRWMCRWKKMWSHFFTSFHIFLHLFTSFYIFSHLFTSCHILPHFLNFDNIKSV